MNENTEDLKKIEDEITEAVETPQKKKKVKKKKVKKQKLSKAEKRAQREAEQLAAVSEEFEEMEAEILEEIEPENDTDFKDVGFLSKDNTYDVPYSKKANLELELPNVVKRLDSATVVGNKYAKVLTISDTEDSVNDITFDAWANLLPNDTDGYMALTIRPVLRSQRRKELDDEIRNLNAELMNPKLSPSDRQTLSTEVETKQNELSQMGQRGYVSQNAIVFFEPSNDLANSKSKAIIQKLKDNYALSMKETHFNSLEELTSNSALGPRLGIDEYFRESTADEIKVRFPWKNQLQVKPNGVNMGNDKKGFPVFYDFLSVNDEKKGNDNRNMAILADSGNGKTYTTSALMMNAIFQGHTFCVIDSEGEFVSITETLGGKSIKFDATTDISMNLFDLGKPFEEEFEEHGQKVKRMITGLELKKTRLAASLINFAVLLQNGTPLTDSQRTLVMTTLDELYDLYGFTEDPESLYIDGKLKPMPQFTHFYKLLARKGEGYLEKKHSFDNSFDAEKYEERLFSEEGFSIRDYTVIKNIFKSFSKEEDGVYKIFDCATPTDFSLNNWEDLPVINFDISKIIEQNNPGKDADTKSVLLLTTLLEWIQIGFLNTHPEISKALIVDEFFRFTSDLQPLAKYTSGFFAGQARTIRKRNAFLWLITQNVHELNNDAGREIIGQTKHLITLGFAKKDANYNGLRGVAGFTDDEIMKIYDINSKNSREVKEDASRGLKGHYLYKTYGETESKELHLITSDYQHKAITRSAKGGK